MGAKQDIGLRLVHASANFAGQGVNDVKRTMNVASVTHRGTGLYTINFATPAKDAYYCVAVSNRANRAPGIDGATPVRTMTAVNIQNTQPMISTNEDAFDMSVIIFF